MRPAHLNQKRLDDALTLFKSRKGEMNLFVVRDIATRQEGGVEMVMNELSKHYKILHSQRISWKFRWFKAHTIRGGKWKRGGKPKIAVIVFDPEPIEIVNENDASHTHPFVFNARQFFKPEFREAFSRRFKINPKLNPLHSADNEFEALEHLPFLFSGDEVKQIESLCQNEREKL